MGLPMGNRAMQHIRDIAINDANFTVPIMQDYKLLALSSIEPITNLIQLLKKLWLIYSILATHGEATQKKKKKERTHWWI